MSENTEADNKKSVIAFVLAIAGIIVAVIGYALVFLGVIDSSNSWGKLVIPLIGIAITGIGGTMAQGMKKKGEGNMALNKASGILEWVLLVIVVVSIVLINFVK
ncbi:MAG TPA: hypothetical protein O0X70_04895 [Methanocorpusculum sp.]|nr:hypothetical protein [Methanocorpusculum sp.]